MRASPEHDLQEGTTGTVVDLLDGRGRAYEVEVVSSAGATLFLGALPARLLEAAPAQTSPNPTV